jgi:hypothetical protein
MTYSSSVIRKLYLFRLGSSSLLTKISLNVISENAPLYSLIFCCWNSRCSLKDADFLFWTDWVII